MQATILWPLLVMLAGGIIYLLAGVVPPPQPNQSPTRGNLTGRVAELARIAYFVGLFFTVASVANQALKL